MEDITDEEELVMRIKRTGTTLVGIYDPNRGRGYEPVGAAKEGKTLLQHLKNGSILRPRSEF